MGTDRLWNAVTRLTETTRTRLERDGGRGEWVTVDSLWTQLVDAMETGAGNNRTRTAQGSRPPCDTTAMSLVIEIAAAVGDACRGLDIKQRHDTPADLRQIASALTTAASAGDEGDEADWWATTVNEWCGKIVTTISNDPDRTWRLHGYPCPACGADHKLEQRDGYHYRVPVVEVVWRDGLVRAVTCTVCTFTAMRGTEFDDIAARHTTDDRMSA